MRRQNNLHNLITKDRLFVQITYDDLLGKLWLMLLFGINCEIYISSKLIDSYDVKDIYKLRASLDKRNILRRLHAPIYDPYAKGFGVFKESYEKSLRFCSVLGISDIVMHVEFDSEKSPSIEYWLDGCKDVWKDIASLAERANINILLENHNESTPQPILELIRYTGSPNIKACFDIGHFNAFSEDDVVSLFESYPTGMLKEFHLSDNMGDWDSHLPIGAGNINFRKFFKAVAARNIDAFYTIEAKGIWGVLRGMSYLRLIGILR